jgi:ADP-dependent NAD(P)H-hydrate dehydratase / NAD(P)H-hydrate epimerase
MKLLSCSQIREADAFTIKNEPIKSIDLMERAAGNCYKWLAKRIRKEQTFHIFCGLGNNGGDGLVIARMLAKNDFKVNIYIIRHSENCSEDFKINEERLLKIKNIEIINISDSSQLNTTSFPEHSVIIDAIFGSGLSKPISGLVKDIVQLINKNKTVTISIDIPSGLFGEDNKDNDKQAIIKADYTLTFQFPKLSFLFAENDIYVGDWQLINIDLHPEFIENIDSNYMLLHESDIKPKIMPRNKFSHKGIFGHALLISGSYGKMGAAVLASKAALKIGAGLLTTHIPKCGYNILQTAIPEAMVVVDDSEHYISNNIKIDTIQAIAIGPGIGMKEETAKTIKLLIQNSTIPIIFDADAINILAENKTWLSFIPKNSIFTPHPKEFERIAGKTSNSFERLNLQKTFAIKYSSYVVVKGAFTSIACPDGKVYFNTTGNPGMATAGSGDVLTGILLGLFSQGYSAKDTCMIGVYLHGLAGDIAAQRESHESIIAGDIVNSISKAYKKIRGKKPYGFIPL